VARHDNRGQGGRYARANPFYDADDERRGAALKAHSDSLGDRVAHDMLDRDFIRRQVKQRRGEHPEVRFGLAPSQKRGFDGPVPEVVDDLVQAAYYTHLWNPRVR
jgi:hypothetical protein